MRKKISVLMALLMVLSFGPAVFAEGLFNPDLPRVVDYADCFSDSEEQKLEQMIGAVSQSHEKDIVIYTDIDDHGKSLEAGAEDFYDENGYGYGEKKSGTILYICFDPDVRAWYTSACGDSIDYIDYDTINIIDDVMEGMMINGEFFEAAEIHIDCLDELYTNGKLYNDDFHQVYTGDGEYSYYEDDEYDQSSPEPVWKMLLAALFFAVCLGVAAGVAAKKKAIASMTTVGLAGLADNYTVRGSFKLTRMENIFLTMTVHRTPKVQPQNNNSNHGGMHSGGSSFSPTHMSSGGSFHSGGGGRHF